MSTFVGEGRGDVTAAEIERWVRFVYQADDEHRDTCGGVPPAVIAAEAASEHRHRVTVRRHLENDQRVETTNGIGPSGPRLTFVPAADTNEVLLDVGEGIETDGGQVTEGNRIDPLVCPRGHHAVAVSSNRINCRTCRNQGREITSWNRSELVDLRREEPPLAEPELRADGGRDRKRRRDSIVEAVLAGRRPSERLRTILED